MKTEEQKLDIKRINFRTISKSYLYLNATPTQHRETSTLSLSSEEKPASTFVCKDTSKTSPILVYARQLQNHELHETPNKHKPLNVQIIKETIVKQLATHFFELSRQPVHIYIYNVMWKYFHSMLLYFIAGNFRLLNHGCNKMSTLEDRAIWEDGEVFHTSTWRFIAKNTHNLFLKPLSKFR